MAITHNITIDVHKRGGRTPQQVVVRVGDVGTQTISATITKDGAAYTSSCSTVRLDVLHADGHWSRVTATKSGSTVTVTLPSAVVSVAGRCKLAHLVFYSGTSYAESTEGFELVILPNVDASDADAAAQDYDDQLTALWEKWNAYESAAEQAEAARVSAESTRAANEAARKSNEAARQSAETSRAAAEKDRAAESATLKADSEKATAAANGAASSANAAASTALQIANSVAQGSAGDSDIAELRAQVDALGSMVADLKGEFYYLDGTIYAPSSKASISGTTVTLADTCSASGTTITLA